MSPVVKQLGQQHKGNVFEPIITFQHKYPPTKLMWVPDIRGNMENIMATSGESLKIFKINNETK